MMNSTIRYFILFFVLLLCIIDLLGVTLKVDFMYFHNARFVHFC